jgi:hypothetical protein
MGGLGEGLVAAPRIYPETTLGQWSLGSRACDTPPGRSSERLIMRVPNLDHKLVSVDTLVEEMPVAAARISIRETV